MLLPNAWVTDILMDTFDATLNGGYIKEDLDATIFFIDTSVAGEITLRAQALQVGYVKGVKLRLFEKGWDVHIQVLEAHYLWQWPLDEDLSDDSVMKFIAESETDKGYGAHSFRFDYFTASP